MEQIINRIRQHVIWSAAISLAALVLYLFGIKLFLLPLLVLANALLLPLSAIFKSFVSRLVVGGMVTAVLLQIAATAQFLLLPNSGFRTLAVITWLLHIALLLVAPPKPSEATVTWVSKHDFIALIVAGFFLLPFVPAVASGNSIERIANMGSVQAIDATNHYAGIAEMTEAEHLNYKPGFYYPKGFHIATGFTQNSLFDAPYKLSWNGNAILYFSHYVLWGSLLAYLLYYLGLAFSLHIMNKTTRKDDRRTGLWFALTLAPTMAVVYLVPFVTQGFLNYYYVLATIVIGLVVLLELYEKPKNDELPDLAKNSAVRWGLFGYLLFIFGASVSWPLLIPPLVLIALLCILPDSLNLKVFFKSLFNWRVLPIIFMFLLQLVPVYFQLKYAGSDGSQGSINAQGGLKEFHPYVLLAGVLLVLGLVLSKSTTQAFRRLLLNIFMPLAAFIGLLVLLQYYSIGEVRYYAIKSSILLEIIFLVLAAVVLLNRYFETNNFAPKYAIMLPVVPFVIMVILIGSAANPVKPLRDLFRDNSGQGYPTYFHEDVGHYVDLGGQGKIKHFNSTVLHYNYDEDKYFAHMQMPFWANMMQYDSSRRDFEALHCVGALYSNLAFGNFTAPEQEALVKKVKQCASTAKDNGRTFYILTDKASAPIIQNTFGDLVKIIY